MKTKEEIVNNWLPRYTGKKLEDFGQYILLTNFGGYVKMFAEWNKVEVEGLDRPMQSATFDNITIINFSMGSAMAATIMDLLTAISPKAVLFLGKCGGLKKKNQIGDFILPIAAIRGEGTSNDYLPIEVPALPSFNLQKAISYTIRLSGSDYWTGTVFTTAVCGNMTKNLKNTFVKCVQWQLIWKRQLFLVLDSIMKFQQALYF